MQVNLPRGGGATPEASTAAAVNDKAKKLEGAKVKNKDVAPEQNALDVMNEKKAKEAEKEAVKDLLSKTLEVVDLIMPHYEVRYEVVEEADCVQVQVVNKEDGEIVRKIPADDVLKLVKRIHEVLNARIEDGIDIFM